MNYQNLTENLTGTRSELNKTSREKDSLKTKINTFILALNDLKK